MIWLAIVMAVVGLSAAAVLSLVIRSPAQGLAISMVFLVPALIGLLSLDGRFGQYLAFVAGAGFVGCAGAIGTFRFWTGGTPVARAIITVAVLAAAMAGLATAVYFGIPG